MQQTLCKTCGVSIFISLAFRIKLSIVASHSCTALRAAASEKSKVKGEIFMIQTKENITLQVFIFND